VALIDGAPAVASAVTIATGITVGGLTVESGDAVTVANTYSLTVAAGGSLLNNGTVSILANGSSTYLSFSGRQTLDGTGEVVLSDNSYAILSLTGTDKVLTQADGHTIRGSGRLLNNTGDFVNRGTVRATGSVALTLDPLAFCVNEGVMRAEGSGGLVLAAAAFTNDGHTIEILPGSLLTLRSGATVFAGTLASSGNGRIVPDGGSRLNRVSLAPGSLVDQATGTGVTILGGLTNHGTWAVGAAGLTTTITFSGNQALAGTGELVFSDSTYGRLMMGASAESLVHEDGHTIRGAGHLLDNTGNLINRGAIRAQGNNPLELDPTSFVVNEGTLRAEGAGGLEFAAGAYTNAGHVIEVADGSLLTLRDSAKVVGGNLTTFGTGRIKPLSGSHLIGVTLAPGACVAHANGFAVTVSGGLMNHGSWQIGGAGITTTLIFSGDQSLDGSGEITTTDSTYNRIILASTSETLVHGAGHTIRGAGDLLDGVGNLVNEGTILAQGAKALVIDPSSVCVNRGTLRAEGAGGLSLSSGTYTNDGHVIDAATGSKVTLMNGAVLVGGTLATTGTGQIVPASGSRLNGVTIASGAIVAHPNGAAVTLTDGIVNRGRWLLNGGGITTTLTFSGDQTLGGSGELVLTDSTYNRVAMAATSQTLTHGSGHTIRGAGYLLNNTGDLDNYGTILAVGAKKLIINPYASFRNLGSGRLGGTGTMALTDGFAANAGTIAPGLSVGTLTIEGNVSNASSAVFDFELGGTGSGQSDRLAVQGSLALDGELRLSFANGYLPEPEDTITIISATSLSGTFANAVPLSGNTASNVLTDIGTCDVTYDYVSSPKTVAISNIRPDPTLLRAVGITTSGEVRTIQFAPSATDWLYTLQYRASLLEGDWSNVPGQGPRPGIGRRDAMVHTNAPAAGFYRVRGAPAAQ